MKMNHSIKAKLHNRRGFSLAETFLAMLILVMVSSVVAGGVPVAASVYYKIVDSANAQVLLSTTMTVLRDELGTAKDVEGSGDTLTYTTSSGGRVTLTNGESAGADGVVPETTVPAQTTKNGIERRAGDAAVPLVSKAAANKNLHTIYDSVSYNGGVITFTNLKVLKDSDGTELAGVEVFKVRVLSVTG